jgi:hypothetical protein
MASGGNSAPPALGFLTVVEHAEHGLFGGYLLLNASGRPLEFHCTTPVKPNRAQEILYGPTLGPYLYGELIGQALVAKAAVEPLIVCTDLPQVLALRALVEWPVALVLPDESPQTEQSTPSSNSGADEGLSIAGRVARVDRRHEAPAAHVRFRLGRNHLAVDVGQATDQALIHSRLAKVGEHFDLAEPFDRIREAIEEAQRTGR